MCNKKEVNRIMKLANEHDLDPTPLIGTNEVAVYFKGQDQPYFIKKYNHLVKAIENKLNVSVLA